MNIINSFKKLQQGSTLIEIIVSIIILSIGITSFIVLEAKTFGNINETYQKKIIANAVYNLSQNILINPILNPDDGSKKYDYYQLSNAECSDKYFKKIDTEENIMSKEQFAQNNLTDFCNNIANVTGLSLENINIVICNNDTLKDSNEQKIINNNDNDNNKINLTCDDNGTQTIIKVAWKLQLKNKKKYKYFYYSIALNQ